MAVQSSFRPLRTARHRTGNRPRRAYGIFHIIFRTEVFAPVLAYVGPVKDFIGWVVEDPGRAWIALAALVIPRIGLYYLLFEGRK